MAIGGPGFGEALFKNTMAQKQSERDEMKLELEKGELGFRLQDMQERRRAAKQEMIQKNFQQSVGGMKTFSDAVKELGPNFKAGSPLDKAIDTQKGIVAKWAELAGEDPNIGQAMADATRAMARAPQKPVLMSPGQSMVDPQTGQPVASLPPAPTQAQSPAGKVLQDRQLFVQQYGDNSPQVRAFDEMASESDVKLTEVAGARKEFTAQSKDFVTIRDAFGKVAVAAANPSAAGDLSLIFGFMKMLDPASTVREGEFANAQNAAGIPDRVVNMYNKALRGERLNDEQRNDFTAQAKSVFNVQLQAQLKNEENYRGVAKRNKMREADVVLDFIGPYRKVVKGAPAPGKATPGPGTPNAENDPLGLRTPKK